MRHEGNVVAARARYFGGGSRNLRYLLAGRFSWMNAWIRPEHHGMEVGCGTGIGRTFIRNEHYLLTDFTDAEWLDVKHVDALHTPFADEQFDFVVSSNMVHHVPYPMRFFDEMRRILKPDGVLLIQEVNASLAMRVLLRTMRHEGYDFGVDVFGNEICTDPEDLWSANCAIPNLLWDDMARFEREVPGFRCEHTGFSEFLTMINSGGVIAKTIYIPLPDPLLRAVGAVDHLLTAMAPQLLAMQRQIVLRRTPGDSPTRGPRPTR